MNISARYLPKKCDPYHPHKGPQGRTREGTQPKPAAGLPSFRDRFHLIPSTFFCASTGIEKPGKPVTRNGSQVTIPCRAIIVGGAGVTFAIQPWPVIASDKLDPPRCRIAHSVLFSAHCHSANVPILLPQHVSA